MTRILVVDDEVQIVEMYRTMLEVHGHEVVGTANNGQEAVAAYDAGTPEPEVVLMDFRMPVKDGLDATREIVAKHPDAKVVIVSADATVGPNCKPAGAAGYLEKPVPMVAMMETITLVTSGSPDFVYNVRELTPG